MSSLNYTVSSSKKDYPGLDTIQYTLSGRVFPSKRNVVDNLKTSPFKNDIIIHWDFIYLLSRYKLFQPSVRKAITNSILDITSYGSGTSNIKGLIMHTDFPIKKSVYKNPTEQNILKEYTSNLWDKDSILKSTSCFDTILLDSLLLFAEEFNKECSCKIYLENTTKVPEFNNQGSLDYLISVLDNHQELQKMFGVCVDLEHDYAVTGRYCDKSFIKDLSSKFSLIVHLNTIPEEVKPKSGKDRHSNTTIFECSLNSPEFYMDYNEFLTDNKIPFVREVKEETMLREIQQLKDHGYRSI